MEFQKLLIDCINAKRLYTCFMYCARKYLLGSNMFAAIKTVLQFNRVQYLTKTNVEQTHASRNKALITPLDVYLSGTVVELLQRASACLCLLHTCSECAFIFVYEFVHKTLWLLILIDAN